MSEIESPKPETEALENALQDWTPDEAPPSETSAAIPGPVTFVADPFGLTQNEILDAQAIEGELSLDEDLELDLSASDSMLEQLSEAVERQNEEQRAQLEEVVEQEKEDSAARLAAEIAEDQALQASLEAEAAAEEAIDPELLAALPKLPVADENGQLDLSELQSCIETLLFMSDRPVSTTRLQELLGPDFPFSLFQEAVTALLDRYQHPAHGFELVEVGGGLQFRTKPGRAALAKKLAKVQQQRLSSGAMETLALIAYKQPLLKEDIDKIRGVDSSHFVRTLMERKLVAITGRSELPGKPMLYGTTPEFLELFGLKDLNAMPSLRELEQMVPGTQNSTPDEEDPRVREMRRLVSQMKADQSGALKYDPREDEKILKDIREKVNQIPTSTPWLDEQKAIEKQAAAEAAARARGELPDATDSVVPGSDSQPKIPGLEGG